MRFPPSVLRTALPCVAVALLACACDRPLASTPPPANAASVPPPANAASAPQKASGQAAKAAPSAQPPSPASPSAGLPPLPRPPSDAQITERVAAAMREDPALAGADLTVHTDHGVVSVTGTVRSPEQVAEAEAHAQAPAGVMRVDTRLSMAPP